MKIIEAMKRVKANKEKIVDLHGKIGQFCASLNYETPTYGADTPAKITEWLQSCNDLSQENVRLLCAIQRTNIATQVSITLGEKVVTKSIAEWVWRRREYAAVDAAAWAKLTDRNLKEGIFPNSAGQPTEVKIVRHFDPVQRDKKLEEFRSEPHEIDAALEVVNAITDLVEQDQV
jgi:hypothetical protein